MTLSARNRLQGTIASIETDGLTAEVTIELGDGQHVTSVITANSVDRLELEEGMEASAVIKATEVMIDA
ncbi:TOBE domain-containing protein [Halobaculum lipolyticum]|uniref:Molybdopterin-binding protein n=1 Tax=Halobaculum lipolyticum TaxID=3032001 RepID=A0ABD5W8D8_9EURY|nr:TOBE domain-containing protein [Halobaculum sp. DT31]